MIRYWLHLVLVYRLSPFLSECGTSGNNPVICRFGSTIAGANFNPASVNALFCFAARQIRFGIDSALGGQVLAFFRRILIADAEIRDALSEPIRLIVRAIRETLDQIPPELSADIYDRGIALCGGGSLLRNLDRRIREETHLPVQLVEDPLSAVVVGAGKMLDDDVLLRKLSVN